MCFVAGAQLVVPYDMYAAALCLDGPTLANLELLEGSSGEAEGSLLAALDTCTSPGAVRLLLIAFVHYVSYPSMDLLSGAENIQSSCSKHTRTLPL